MKYNVPKLNEWGLFSLRFYGRTGKQCFTQFNQTQSQANSKHKHKHKQKQKQKNKQRQSIQLQQYNKENARVVGNNTARSELEETNLVPTKLSQRLVYIYIIFE